jgi:hypothetical protein
MNGQVRRIAFPRSRSGQCPALWGASLVRRVDQHGVGFTGSRRSPTGRGATSISGSTWNTDHVSSSVARPQNKTFPKQQRHLAVGLTSIVLPSAVKGHISLGTGEEPPSSHRCRSRAAIEPRQRVAPVCRQFDDVYVFRAPVVGLVPAGADNDVYASWPRPSGGGPDKFLSGPRVQVTCRPDE